MIYPVTSFSSFKISINGKENSPINYLPLPCRKFTLCLPTFLASTSFLLKDFTFENSLLSISFLNAFIIQDHSNQINCICYARAT